MTLPPSRFARAAALLDTARQVGPRRMATRALRRLRYRVLYPALGERLYGARQLPEPPALPAERDGDLPGAPPADLPLDLADALCAHRFEFVGLPPEDLGAPIDWQRAPGEDRLWQYTLHYGDWALPLAVAARTAASPADRTRYRDALIALVDDWIAHNPVGREPAWEPYPLSRRIAAFGRAARVLAADETFARFLHDRLAPSLLRQARVLEANLEGDLANNHLLANYHALAWLALAFPRWPDAAARGHRATTGLWREMRTQVLADGVHDERSTSYHAIVLSDLCEIAELAETSGAPLPGDVRPTLARMARFLAATRFPDGTWPLLNDSVPGYPPDMDRILARGAAGLAPFAHEPCSVFADAGYVVLRAGVGEVALFDAGDMGPARMLGHGHADALSFVLHGAGRPLVVDPGVYTYREGEWRDRFRGTAAHATIAVDGEDQCVLWGAFRVAHPARARLLSTSDTHAEGDHDGYRRLASPLVHRRRIERVGASWHVLDGFDGATAEHEFALALPLAPGAEVTVDDRGARAEARWPEGATLSIVSPSPPPGARFAVAEGWVSPGWNAKVAAPRVVLRWRGRAPTAHRVILTVGR